MNFLLNIKKTAGCFVPDQDIHRYIKITDSNYHKHTNQFGDILFWIGDLVLPEGFSSIYDFMDDLINDFDVNKLLKAGGFYYVILFLKKENCIYVYTGLFNVLPIYYACNDEQIIVSSSLKQIISNLKVHPNISKKFILEKLLFNYSFFDGTIYKDVKMLPGNHCMKIDSKGLHLIRHTGISDWFEAKPFSSKDAYLKLAECFNHRIKAYLPDSQYYLSFTGGFDGRTLLSASIKNNKNFTAYSFGTSNSDDVVIPLAQAKQLGINYNPFYLNSDNYLKTSLKHGLELVKETAQSTDYIITGNFGSEVFRSAHLTGVMISPFLYKLFAAKDLKGFVYNYEYPELYFLNKDQFHDEIEHLKSELCAFELFHSMGLSLNQRFCVYLFEDIFRKYFGSEIVVQSKYLQNRTPFLDYQFVREVFKTNLASVYSKFYENNPIKRFKGQLLYAYIIKENSEKIYFLRTGKGYRPSDLINPLGKSFLVLNYMKKKIYRKIGDPDPFSVRKAFKINTNQLMNIRLDRSLFKQKKIFNSIKNLDAELNNLINVLSLNWYIHNE